MVPLTEPDGSSTNMAAMISLPLRLEVEIAGHEVGGA
jgi:hypothetical protein